MSVKAFVSHATEDKKRFVVGFATRLRERGIDAWVDQWEIKPGDSLVQKIFTEGLDKSDVIIAVLSKFSIRKRWVHEELDASVVNKIQKDAKIIPVVLDGLTDQEVPQVLRATLHVKINDLDAYDGPFNRVVDAIYGHSDKPPLGKPPAYVQARVDLVPGLNKVDSLIFKMVCDQAMDSDMGTFAQFYLSPKEIEPHGISPQAAQDSLDMLESLHFIQTTRTISGVVSTFTITVWGFEQYARAFVSDYTSLIEKVTFYVANHENAESHGIAETLGVSHTLACHALCSLEQQRLVTLGLSSSSALRAAGSYGQAVGRRVVRLSPQLKRALGGRL